MHSPYDITSENFDYFFLRLTNEMSDLQFHELPDDIRMKMKRGAAEPKAKYPHRMTFIQKMFVLFRALKKRVIIIVEDEDNGIGEDEFNRMKANLKNGSETIDDANDLLTHSIFVLGNRELCDTYHRMSGLSASGAYSYLVNAKNRTKSQMAKWFDEMSYIARFISHYEANRKILGMESGINFTEWLVLIHLYHGEVVQSSPIYQKWYRRSFNSSSTKMKVAFRTLQIRGYIEKYGVSYKARIRITPLGRSKVNEVLSKYVLNC